MWLACVSRSERLQGGEETHTKGERCAYAAVVVVAGVCGLSAAAAGAILRFVEPTRWDVPERDQLRLFGAGAGDREAESAPRETALEQGFATKVAGDNRKDTDRKTAFVKGHQGKLVHHGDQAQARACGHAGSKVPIGDVSQEQV